MIAASDATPLRPNTCIPSSIEFLKFGLVKASRGPRVN
jgi:hypothetical protein